MPCFRSRSRFFTGQSVRPEQFVEIKVLRYVPRVTQHHFAGKKFDGHEAIVVDHEDVHGDAGYMNSMWDYPDFDVGFPVDLGHV
ncbi:hypothetical protein SAMN02745830_04720 [Streptomyces sp. Amel2xC10]|nr:hypothetical protein SAMN02745830_04720 [Streptomyces sp. Amel2xC10]